MQMAALLLPLLKVVLLCMPNPGVFLCVQSSSSDKDNSQIGLRLALKASLKALCANTVTFQSTGGWGFNI